LSNTLLLPGPAGTVARRGGARADPRGGTAARLRVAHRVRARVHVPL
jgi:hypothetical protein